MATARCELQPRHHRTENEQLFPEAVARLDAEALQQLQGELEYFDAEPSHSERRASAMDLGEELIARYPAIEPSDP